MWLSDKSYQQQETYSETKKRKASAPQGSVLPIFSN